MLDIKDTGLVHLAVSIMYATTVGKADARASVMIAPDADQVKTSICPGVSNMAYLGGKMYIAVTPKNQTEKRKNLINFTTNHAWAQTKFAIHTYCMYTM